MAGSKNNNLVILITAAAVLVLLVILFFIIYQMGGRLYFSKPEEATANTFLGQVDLSSCSEGMVLVKTASGWKCDLNNKGKVVAGGWDADYSESCIKCTVCGTYWGEGSCTSTTGTSAYFQCSKGTKQKTAEYGVGGHKTYWYQCIV